MNPIPLILFLASRASCQEMIVAKDLWALQVQHAGFTLIDVRMHDEFERKRIDGAINLAIDSLEKISAGKNERIVLYCNSAHCAKGHEAARLLNSRGYVDVKVLFGGLDEWERQGFLVVSDDPRALELTTRSRNIPEADVDCTSLAKLLTKGESTAVIDVRPPREFLAGHILGAINVPLETLWSRYTLLPKAKGIVIIDRQATRSRKAAEFLASSGYSVRSLLGGISAWMAGGFSLIPGNSVGLKH